MDPPQPPKDGCCSEMTNKDHSIVKLIHILYVILENLGEDSSSCYQAKVKSTPSLSLKLKTCPRTGVGQL